MFFLSLKSYFIQSSLSTFMTLHFMNSTECLSSAVLHHLNNFLKSSSNQIPIISGICKQTLCPLSLNFPEAPNRNTADAFLCLRLSHKGLISTDKLVGMRGVPLDKIKTALGQGLNLSLSEDVWYSILQLINSTSLCACHCLMQLKVIHRSMCLN